MSEPPFSRRYGFAPEQQPKPETEVPLWIRGEFAHILQNQIGQQFRRTFYEHLRPMIWSVLDIEPPSRGELHWNWAAIRTVIDKCAWWQFYDLCELTFATLADVHQLAANDLAREVNALFASDLLAWQFNQDGNEVGKIERARPTEITEVFEELKGLLAAGPKYSGPNEQFRKANGHLAKRPEPDTENCVKDAVGALEGVARIITNQPKRTLGQLLSGEPLTSVVPPLLLTTIEKLWAYRSDEPGVGHGRADQQSTVDFEEADWVLSMCATAMVYLVKKFPS